MRIFGASIQTWVKLAIGVMVVVALMNFVPQLKQFKQGV